MDKVTRDLTLVRFYFGSFTLPVIFWNQRVRSHNL